jgi:peptidyl-prolyl cis-trans isomerase A (cyclophilin A)
MKKALLLAVLAFAASMAPARHADLAGSAAAGPETGSPRVVLETEQGDITVEVYPGAAPASAGDFLTYVEQGLYDGAVFYRAVHHGNDNGEPKIEVLQGGLKDFGLALPPVAHESTRETGLLHTTGALSLARGDVGTGSAGAFFIVLSDQPGLDHGGMRNPDGQGFAVFGRVVEGMEVVRRIHALPTDENAGDEYVRGQLLAEPVVIRRARPDREFKP